MNRRQAIAALGATLLPLHVAVAAQADKPTLTIHDALKLAEALVKEQKIDTEGKHIASAVLKETRWEILWKPTNPRTLGGQFVVHVHPDKTIKVVRYQ
jgi:hypothetical protein